MMKKKGMNQYTYQMLRDIGFIVLSVIVALAIGAIFLLSMGYNPFEAYGIIVSKAITDFGQIMRRSTALMMTALAVAIPAKCGVFNMGGEGQIIAGALAAGVIGTAITAPSGIHVIIAIAAAMITGGLLALVPAFMKVKFKSNEVVVTLMMNYVVQYVVQYLTMYKFRGSDYAVQTAPIQGTAEIPVLVQGEQWSMSFVIAVFVCIVSMFVLNSTRFGLELKSAGFNQRASKFQHINVKSMSLLAMVIGGMVAALGGALEVLGGTGYYFDSYFSNYGFDGVAIAYMAKQNPIAIILTSLIIGALKVGAIALARTTDISMYFSYMLQGIIIVMLVSPYVVEFCVNKLGKKSKKVQG